MVDAKRKVYRRAQLATDRARRAYRVFYIIYIFTRYRVSNDLFFAEYKRLSSGRGFFHALSAPGNAEGPPAHHGTSVSPPRAPWRVLWAFKVAKSGKKQSRSRLPRSSSRPRQWKTSTSAVLLHCCKKGNNMAFYSPVANRRHTKYNIHT